MQTVFVSDGDGYIVLAGSAPLGTVYDHVRRKVDL